MPEKPEKIRTGFYIEAELLKKSDACLGTAGITTPSLWVWTKTAFHTMLTGNPPTAMVNPSGPTWKAATRGLGSAMLGPVTDCMCLKRP